jgi:homoaconitase/3-isopropylmalate dehydratase large subunit
MSQTIAEKIISSHCGQETYVGETVVASIDMVNYISSTGDFPSA